MVDTIKRSPGEMFDLFQQQFVHTEPMHLEPYSYRLPCFCGEEIRLIPEDGASAECPAGCGGIAYFSGSSASMELMT